MEQSTEDYSESADKRYSRNCSFNTGDERHPKIDKYRRSLSREVPAPASAPLGKSKTVGLAAVCFWVRSEERGKLSFVFSSDLEVDYRERVPMAGPQDDSIRQGN